VGTTKDPQELAEALETVPYSVLREGSARWQNVVGRHTRAVSPPAMRRWIASQALNPNSLTALERSLSSDEKRFLALSRVHADSALTILAIGAGLGFGDLCPALERCAALGLAIPLKASHGGGSLWARDHIIYRKALGALVRPGPVDRIAGDLTFEPLNVVPRTAIEPVLSIPPEQTTAALLHMAGVLAVAPIRLTKGGQLSQRELSALAREIGASRMVPVAFLIALAIENGILAWTRLGDRDALGVPDSVRNSLWHTDDPIVALLKKPALSGVFTWDADRGDVAPDAREPLALSPVPNSTYSILWKQWIGSMIVWGALLRVQPRGSWFLVTDLANQITEAAPAWWKRPGEPWWYTDPSWLLDSPVNMEPVARVILHLVRTLVRLGLIELGAVNDPRVAERARESFPGLDDPQDVIDAASGIYARTTPLWEAMALNGEYRRTPSGLFRIGADLEVHMEPGALSLVDATTLEVASERLPFATGDPIWKYRLTSDGMQRALNAGIPPNRILALLDRSRPSVPPSVRRTVEGWITRVGMLTLHLSWTLLEWPSTEARDAAVAKSPAFRPAGKRWALVPASSIRSGHSVQLPAPHIAVNAAGILTLAPSEGAAVARAAVERLCQVTTAGHVSLDADRLARLGISSPREVVDILKPWASGTKRCLQVIEHEAHRALGITVPAHWVRAHLVRFPSEEIARRVARILSRAHTPPIRLDGRTLALLHGLDIIRKIASEEGLALSRSEPDVFHVSQKDASSPTGRQRKGPATTIVVEGRDMDVLPLRTLRTRLEAAAESGRDLWLYARPGRSKVFRLLHVRPIHVISSSPLQLAFTDAGGEQTQRTRYVDVRDIIAISEDTEDPG